jgi:hypothetical protein
VKFESVPVVVRVNAMSRLPVVAIVFPSLNTFYEHPNDII